MNYLFKKKFSLKMCLNFSKLSKDKNILHLDKKLEKYSQFQKPIVQGVQVVKFILENIKINEIFYKYNSISIIFVNPIFINEKIFFEFKNEKKNIFLIGKNSFQQKIILKFDLQNNYEKQTEKEKKKFSASKLIKELITLTKNIGNFKKNLNLISTIEIYKKENTKKKRFIKLSNNFYKFEYQNKDISLSAFFLSYKKKFKEDHNFEFKIKPNKHFLQDKKILIIGASSGLGKILTSYFLKNKINFDLTYNKNFKTLNFFKKKYKINSKKIYKLNNVNLNKFKHRFMKYDIIYFFPTSKIFSYSEKFFDFKRFNKLNLINIKFLLSIVNLISETKKTIYLFVPSSKLANEYKSNAEYSLSKNIQEKIIKKINQSYDNIKVFNPRLDAYLTKSTKGLINIKLNYDDFIKQAIKF